MVRLLAAVESCPVLDDDDRVWLPSRAHELLSQYERLTFPLGPSGLVHGDAQVANVLLAVDGRVLLGDWDAVAVGPREWDLVVTAAGDRFGMPVEQRAAFAETYGYDVTSWPEWTSCATCVSCTPSRPMFAGRRSHRHTWPRCGGGSRRFVPGTAGHGMGLGSRVGLPGQRQP